MYLFGEESGRRPNIPNDDGVHVFSRKKMRYEPDGLSGNRYICPSGNTYPCIINLINV